MSTHEPIHQIADRTPSGKEWGSPGPRHAIDCSCGYLSGTSTHGIPAVWFAKEERAREDFEQHLAQQSEAAR